MQIIDGEQMRRGGREESILTFLSLAPAPLQEAFCGIVIARGGLEPPADIKRQEIEGLKIVLMREAEAPIDAFLRLSKPTFEEGRHCLRHMQGSLTPRLVRNRVQSLEPKPDRRAAPGKVPMINGAGVGRWRFGSDKTVTGLPKQLEA
jgi:hypothetical protein